MSSYPAKDDGFKAQLFQLDKNRLDDEWVSQSSLVYAAGVQAAKLRESWERAKVARDVAVDERKEVAASLTLRVKKDPQAFGLESATDKTAEAAVLVHELYKAALNKVYEAEKKVIRKKLALDLAETECRALDPNRLKQLENLTVLDNRGYWDRAKTDHGPKDNGVKERVEDKKLQKRKSTYKRTRKGD